MRIETEIGTALQGIEGRLRALGTVGVALSGGVDSMTLASIAHRALGDAATMYHAVSPAVPPAATARVRVYAERHGWRLTVLDAQEFADERYRANPVNRCYFCKSHLYETMTSVADGVLVSGTNLDDLGDYRPGLEAARERRVLHPFVESGVDKATVRRIAHALGLDDLAELPAAPCLSSRIETGIAIDPDTLVVVNDVELALERELGPRAVRCRVRRGAIVVELDPRTLGRLDDALRSRLRADIGSRFRVLGNDDPVGFTTYHQGSAFLRAGSDG